MVRGCVNLKMFNSEEEQPLVKNAANSASWEQALSSVTEAPTFKQAGAGWEPESGLLHYFTAIY